MTKKLIIATVLLISSVFDLDLQETKVTLNLL